MTDMTSIFRRPILFSAPMVKAILAGRKTQTRRVLKAPGASIPGYDPRADEHLACPYSGARFDRGAWRHLSGVRLWVRETWAVRRLSAGLWVEYRADGHNARLPEHHDIRDEGGLVDLGRYALPADRWRPSIFMPRWASRIDLEITGVRVERVQDISEEDAMAEGVDAVSMADMPRQATMNRRADFKQLWDKINKGRGHGWESNPWVWCLTFKRIGGNL